uniref:Uncharacterized protein n=1 Tax=Setaria italica TaxID=4555 RepID=K3XJR8_SETIT
MYSSIVRRTPIIGSSFNKQALPNRVQNPKQKQSTEIQKTRSSRSVSDRHRPTGAHPSLTVTDDAAASSRRTPRAHLLATTAAVASSHLQRGPAVTISRVQSFPAHASRPNLIYRPQGPLLSVLAVGLRLLLALLGHRRHRRREGLLSPGSGSSPGLEPPHSGNAWLMLVVVLQRHLPGSAAGCSAAAVAAEHGRHAVPPPAAPAPAASVALPVGQDLANARHLGRPRLHLTAVAPAARAAAAAAAGALVCQDPALRRPAAGEGRADLGREAEERGAGRGGRGAGDARGVGPRLGRDGVGHDGGRELGVGAALGGVVPFVYRVQLHERRLVADGDGY